MPLDSSSLAAVGVTATRAGPITKVPPEVLVHILRWLRAIHSRRCDYQADAHHFALACRGFHQAYAMSDGVREYAVGTAGQAAALTQRVRPQEGEGLKVENLWVDLGLGDSRWTDRALGRLVQGCAGDLRQLTWAPSGAADWANKWVNDGLIEGWGACTKLERMAMLNIQRMIMWDDAKL